MKTLGISGAQGWNLAESISVKLYQLFEVSKNPTRETLVVTVGSVELFLVERQNVRGLASMQVETFPS